MISKTFESPQPWVSFWVFPSMITEVVFNLNSAGVGIAATALGVFYYYFWVAGFLMFILFNHIQFFKMNKAQPANI